MNREVRRVGLLVAAATVSLVVLLGAHPFSTARILAGYVLALAAISVAALVRVLGDVSNTRGDSQFERVLAAKPATQPRPPELVRVERELVLGIASEGHLHRRLLPLLREAAAARGGLSREKLGDDAWEFSAPGPPRVGRPHGAGDPDPPPSRDRRDAGGTLMELAEVRTRADAILDEVERSVVGKRDSLQLILPPCSVTATSCSRTTPASRRR